MGFFHARSKHIGASLTQNLAVTLHRLKGGQAIHGHLTMVDAGRLAGSALGNAQEATHLPHLPNRPNNLSTMLPRVPLPSQEDRTIQNTKATHLIIPPPSERMETEIVWLFHLYVSTSAVDQLAGFNRF